MAKREKLMLGAMATWLFRDGASMKVVIGLVAAMAACLLIGTVGCGVMTGTCNEMGCQDGLTLRFEDGDGNRVDGFSGDVTAGGEVVTIECDEAGRGSGDGYRCTQAGSVFIEATGVSEISLNVRHTDQSSNLAYIGGVDVSYQKFQPNGPNCEPTCEQAERTVTMAPTEASGD